MFGLELFKGNQDAHGCNSFNSIPVGKNPQNIEYSPSNNNVYVANTASNDVSAINPSIDTPSEEPRTINDIIKDITQNPLNIINSVEASNEIKKILTDNDQNNDQRACDLLNQIDGEETTNIRNIIGC